MARSLVIIQSFTRHGCDLLFHGVPRHINAAFPEVLKSEVGKPENEDCDEREQYCRLGRQKKNRLEVRDDSFLGDQLNIPDSHHGGSLGKGKGRVWDAGLMVRVFELRFT